MKPNNAIAITAWYIVLGIGWIIGSDYFAGFISSSPNVQTIKGLLFIAVTSVLVFSLVRRVERVHQAREESEERFRTLVEAAPDGILIQVGGKFAYVNAACVELMGASSAEDLLGTDVLDRLHPENQAGALERMDSLARGQPAQQAEQLIVRVDGTTLPVESVAVPFRYQGMDGGLGFIRDISRRKQAAREREKLLKAIEQTADSILITNTEGVIEHVNPATVESSGFSRAELIGATPRIQNSGRHDETFYRDMWQTITAGKTWRGRIINKRKNEDLYTEDVTISPLFEDDTIVSYVAVKRDITHELNLEQQLAQAQKMETVGRLAGGVAHDFNNMLSVILGYNELALAKLPHNDPVRQDLAEISTAAQRSAELTHQLLAFARRQIIDPKVIDMNESVGIALKMLQRLIGEHINLEWHPAPKLWPVLLDPSQIDQILVNLAVNSRDAIADQGQLTIRTANCELTDDDCAERSYRVPGQYVLLSFSDDGHGIDEDVMAHIFEPFFTTKPEGTGTGLGLATVYGITKQNSGFIEVESTRGHGTTFNIFLPRHHATPDETEPHDTLTLPVSGGETILLVEDELSVLTLAQRILENLGYSVLATVSPGQAIQWAEEADNHIDLLFTDVVMPEMNGPELYRRISDIRPEINVLFTSGYTSDTDWVEELDEEHRVFLQKPYSSAVLGNKVRQALDREPRP